MSYIDEMDKEEDRLCDAVNSGEITSTEFDSEMRALRREYRDLLAELTASQAQVEALQVREGELVSALEEIKYECLDDETIGSHKWIINGYNLALAQHTEKDNEK